MLESQKRVTMRTMGEFWHLAGDFMGEISAGPGRASAEIFESFHNARIGEFLALLQIAAVDFLTHSETHFAGKNPLQAAAGPWQKASQPRTEQPFPNSRLLSDVEQLFAEQPFAFRDPKNLLTLWVYRQVQKPIDIGN